MNPNSDLDFDYTNYRGEQSHRRVTPISYRYGFSNWHPEPQWLMMALDHDKNEPREFAMADMTNIMAHPFPIYRHDASYQSPLRDLIVRIDLVAQNHIAYSQCSDAIKHLREHLSALARCEEVNRRDGREVSAGPDHALSAG